MTLMRPNPLPTRTMAQRRSVWHRLNADPAHGPLPALLVGLTALTGIVDAVSILALGRVFVANMTGNVVFAAFALAGAGGRHRRRGPQHPHARRLAVDHSAKRGDTTIYGQDNFCERLTAPSITDRKEGQP